VYLKGAIGVLLIFGGAEVNPGLKSAPDED
jgi:hypothetical protein